jgi:murein L,D-transpeptidase YafK
MSRGQILKYFLLFLLISSVIYNLIPENPLPENAVFDKIEVEKSKRLVHGYYQGKIVKTYKVSFGFAPVAHKQIEGDGRTPEGIYFIDEKNPYSDYNLSLGISYPNFMDYYNAEKLGKLPGGDIKIHGLKNGFCFLGKLHRMFDWTYGCIAVTCGEMEEIYRAMPIGRVVEIKK